MTAICGVETVDLLLRMFAARPKHNQLVKRGAGVVLLAMAASVLSMSPAGSTPASTIVSALTADANNDGRIDQINLTFSTPMAGQPVKAAAPGAPGFRVEGYEIASFGAWSPTGQQLTINLTQKSTPDTGAKPTVEYTSGGGGVNTAGLEMESVRFERTLDRAKPVIVKFEAKDAIVFDAVGDTARVTMSEPVTISGATALARNLALETALTMTPIAGGCNDGVPTGGTFNFPRARETNPLADPIEQPAAGDFATTIVVTYSSSATQVGSTTAATRMAVGGCTARFAAAAVGIIDAAGLEGNSVAGQVPLEALVSEIGARSAETLDVNGDGALDGVAVTFDSPISDATAAAALTSIAISSGGTSITPASVDTGSAANDGTIEFRFASSWNTGVKPTVAYDKPADCASAGITGGGNCVASFQLAAADKARPRFLAAQAIDADSDGTLDGARVRFSEAIGSGTPAGWTVGSVQALTFTKDSQNPTFATLTVAEGSVSGMTPVVAYAAQGNNAGTRDAAENEVVSQSHAAADATGVEIKQATVADTTGNGNVDRVVVEFTRSIVEPVPGVAGDFRYGGAPATGVVAPDGVDDFANDALLTLAVNASGTDAKPLDYIPSATPIVDQFGNVAAAQSLSGSQIVDAAAPRAALKILSDGTLKTGIYEVTATFSEPMKTGSLPVGTFGLGLILPAVDDSHAFGWRTSDASIWDGWFVVSPADCTVSTGCALQASLSGAEDPSGNQQAAPATDTAFVDTVAPSEASALDFAAVLQEGETAPDNVINMFTNGFSVSGTIVAGEAAGGTAELLIDGEPMSPPVKSSVDADDTAVSLAPSFADRDALRAAVSEGIKSFSLRLCDAVENCNAPTTGVRVIVDYTPIPVSVMAPNGGESWDPGAHDVQWMTQPAPDFGHVALHASTNGGFTYPITISSEQAQPAGATSWDVPDVKTSQARVRATSYDTRGNRMGDASDENFTINGTSTSGGGGGGPAPDPSPSPTQSSNSGSELAQVELTAPT
ncbi:MAG TPA: hypothetical protein VM600_09735, partial [Actinomycetota bacterium]|nr:hypothetical protein [Actinomycetota bacterium]